MRQNACLFARLRGQVEDQDCEEGDAHAGKDQVDRVEQGLSAQHQIVLKEESEWMR
jgi:hypothetical protein